MTTKMKGLLKGLRYISQIFDNDKEQEMQIGYPTDVKHVAHIGWDGPSVNSPSWMDGFKSAPELSSGPLNCTGEVKDKPATNLPSEDVNRTGAGIHDSLFRNIVEKQNSTQRHPSSGTSSPFQSPTRPVSDVPKQSRRHRSSSGASGNSPTRDLSGSTRPSRQHRNSGLGSESPSQELPAVSKTSRRKKSKGSSGGGSSRSRSKGQNSLTDTFPFSDPGSGSGSGSRYGLKNNETCPSSVLEVFEEENGCDVISRGIRDL